MCEGRSASWNTVCLAITISASIPNSCPVLGFRSNCGKLELVTSDADAVAGHEAEARRPQIDLEPVDFPRLHQLGLPEAVAVPGPEDALGDVHRVPVRTDVDELYGKSVSGAEDAT